MKTQDAFKRQDAAIKRIMEDVDQSYERAMWIRHLGLIDLLRSAWARGWESRARYEAQKRKATKT